MPTSAPKPCNKPGCGVLVRDGSARCEQHKRMEAKAHDARRGSAHERGYSAAWQRARVGFLKSHPLCKAHEGKGEVVVATVVDHIKPHKGDKALFWDHDNWQALCKPCHDHKTATEDGGGWRR
jgi:5-methylcytosine-specific restriction enzyme A